MNVKFEDIMSDVEKETRESMQAEFDKLATARLTERESMKAAQRDGLLRRLRKLRDGDLDEAVVQHVEGLESETLVALSAVLDSEIWQTIRQQQERQNDPTDAPSSVGSAERDSSGPDVRNGSGEDPGNGSSHS